MVIPDEEQVEDVCEFMAEKAHAFLPFNRWEFIESYRSNKDGRIIFDSQWCRIKFVWNGWEINGGNTISIYYGRLHAPSNDIKMIWNGEECHCWHREELALHYLDGHTPEDTAKSIFTHRVLKEYKQSEIGQNLSGSRRQPEWLVRMHAATWVEYAPRLFEIFDLRRPELWDQYRKFLKEVYDIKGRNPFINPPIDMAC